MRTGLRGAVPASLRRLGRRVARLTRAVARRRRLSRAARPGGALAVYYGRDTLPSADEPATGGILKFQRLAQVLPNSPRRFNLVYLGSNTLPWDWPHLLDLLRRRSLPLAYNQNGVAYPGWYGPGWEEANRPMAAMLMAADHVFFQSRFCRDSAQRFLGSPTGTWEVLHNAVDTTFFVPAKEPLPPRPLCLLLSGKQYQDYPVEAAVRTLGALVRNGIDARLQVTGQLTWEDETAASARLDRWVRREGVDDRVELLGPYSQRTAPAIHHGAHVLLHTKYNDPCPSGVVEALACGLPVVYSASGGVPELVGDEAGRAVPVSQGWERMATPSPVALAEAAAEVAADLPRYRAAARARAVHHLDLAAWQQRHVEVFEALVSGGNVPDVDTREEP